MKYSIIILITLFHSFVLARFEPCKEATAENYRKCNADSGPECLSWAVCEIKKGALPAREYLDRVCAKDKNKLACISTFSDLARRNEDITKSEVVKSCLNGDILLCELTIDSEGAITPELAEKILNLKLKLNSKRTDFLQAVSKEKGLTPAAAQSELEKACQAGNSAACNRAKIFSKKTGKKVSNIPLEIMKEECTKSSPLNCLNSGNQILDKDPKQALIFFNISCQASNKNGCIKVTEVAQKFKDFPKLIFGLDQLCKMKINSYCEYLTKNKDTLKNNCIKKFKTTECEMNLN